VPSGRANPKVGLPPEREAVIGGRPAPLDNLPNCLQLELARVHSSGLTHRGSCLLEPAGSLTGCPLFRRKINRFGLADR
jgi:hypothetical protein